MLSFDPPLSQGLFLKRYKRFFADITLRDRSTQGVAHVANTGSLKGVNLPNQACLYSESKDPNRKLKYSLEAIQSTSGAWVGVNTATPNKLIKAALTSRLLPHWKKLESIKPEHAISKETRFDFAAILPSKTSEMAVAAKSKKVSKKGEESKNSSVGFNYFIEVKNVTMATVPSENTRNPKTSAKPSAKPSPETSAKPIAETNAKASATFVAEFPDSVTERGQKHLRELIRLTEEGNTCEIVFVIQRNDCDRFAPARAIDPDYADLLEQAKKKGVIITPLVFEVTPKGLHFVRELKY